MFLFAKVYLMFPKVIILSISLKTKSIMFLKGWDKICVKLAKI